MMEIPGGVKVIISEEELKNRVNILARQISVDYEGKHPVIVSILKGPLYFIADLTRQIDIPINIDFMSIGLFSGDPSASGAVKITKDLDINIAGRHVIMVEDIINTGLTVGFLVQNLEARKPQSISICTLLSNPTQRLVNLPVKYIGFEVQDIPMVGYGLDSNEEYRHLPYITEYHGEDAS
jgi:hypoxanthine phosphoribosyltransferase